MWGEDWGVMVWGGGAALEQVPIGPWALVAVGFLLGIAALKARSSRLARAVPLVIAVLVPILVVSTPTLITFSNGEVADADEVNANFQAILDELASLRDGTAYSQRLVADVTPTGQCDAWQQFRAALEPEKYHCVRIGGSNGEGDGFCNPATAPAIAAALRDGVSYVTEENGRTWRVGACGTGFELSAGATATCGCTLSASTVRPCIGNDNWGGVGGATCSAPTQTLEVTFR